MIIETQLIKLEELAEGRIFYGDELIVEKEGGRMSTVKKEDFDWIRSFRYEITTSENYFPEDPEFDMFQGKLEGVGLW